MYDPPAIVDLIAGNLSATRNPFALPFKGYNSWWKRARIPQQGKSLLITGMMYQFMPYIETSTKYLERYEDTPLASKIHLARYAPKRLTGLGLAMITPGREKQAAGSILTTITDLLNRSGVDYSYDPLLDAYSGVLLYDLGDQEGFVRQAKIVAGELKKNKISRIITVDPHTTYAFKVLYPKYTGVDFEVTTYFELLNLNSEKEQETVTLHDPCFFGRYLELSDVPNQVLSGLNVECLKARTSGTSTTCCGGPAESVFPSLSRELAQRRLAELPSSNGPIVTMCPICMGNLKRAGARVEDLSSLIARRIAPSLH